MIVTNCSAKSKCISSILTRGLAFPLPFSFFRLGLAYPWRPRGSRSGRHKEITAKSGPALVPILRVISSSRTRPVPTNCSWASEQSSGATGFASLRNEVKKALHGLHRFFAPQVKVKFEKFQETLRDAYIMSHIFNYVH